MVFNDVENERKGNERKGKECSQVLGIKTLTFNSTVFIRSGVAVWETSLHDSVLETENR